MDTSKIKPLRDVVVVIADPVDNVSQSGIVVSVKTDTQKPTAGVVCAAGPDAQVSKGDRIAFTTNIIHTDKDDDGTYLWMRTENVLGVISEA